MKTQRSKNRYRADPFAQSRMKTHLGSYYSQRSPALLGLLVLLFPIFLSNLFSPLGRAYPSLFSEWNAPEPKHLHLLKGALQRHPSLREQIELWSPLPNQGWKPCAASVDNPPLPQKSQGYIQVFLDGGLNQQRMGICDAVAVAKILNATLIIPHLEVNPVWQDSSSFADIFDVDRFIDSLKDEVRIVKDLPSDYFWSTREYYATGIRETRIKTAPVHASADWYLENVLPVLRRYGIVAIAPFSHRLAFHGMPPAIQKLRCKVNFEALVFVPHIRALGDTIVNHLRYPRGKEAVEAHNLQDMSDDITEQGAGKYIVLHLRFDKDMAAHSACEFGGGRAEKLALAKYRQVLWHGRVIKTQFTDEELRTQGRCPLTPEEIGLILVALGFSNTTSLYLASHKVYGGEARISALRKLFPMMEDKRSLASPDERAKVQGKASLMAAVDYYVSMQSDIFISASPGNMHNAMVRTSLYVSFIRQPSVFSELLEAILSKTVTPESKAWSLDFYELYDTKLQLGYRAYKNLKTIRPNLALMGQLFMNKSLTWQEFQSSVIAGHRNRQGTIRVRKERQSIYTYPVPDCMCRA